MKKAIAAFLCAVFLVSCAACSAGSTAETPETTTAAGAETNAQTQGAGAAETTAVTDAKFAWYVPAPHPYFEEVKAGVEAFTKETGIDVEMKIGPDWDQKSESEGIEALTVQGYNYISFYPSDASGAVGMMKELKDSGISFGVFGAPVSEDGVASVFIATDVKQAAYDATKFVIDQMGGKGNLINVLEVVEDPNTQLRKQGVEEAVAEYPDVQIIQEISNMKTSDEASQKIEAAVAANIEEVDGIICTGNTTSVGLANVLKDILDKNEGKTIYSIGMDTDNAVTKAIEDGYMTATIAQNPYGHGYLTMMFLKHLSEGWKVRDGVYSINAGCTIVTKDNLTTYSEDIQQVTQEILGKMETEYLTK